jgi:hypothetical protein
VIDLQFGGIGPRDAVVDRVPVASDDGTADRVDLGRRERVTPQHQSPRPTARTVDGVAVGEQVTVVAVGLFVLDGDRGEDVQREQRARNGRRRGGGCSRRGGARGGAVDVGTTVVVVSDGRGRARRCRPSMSPRWLPAAMTSPDRCSRRRVRRPPLRAPTAPADRRWRRRPTEASEARDCQRSHRPAGCGSGPPVAATKATVDQRSSINVRRSRCQRCAHQP